VLHVVLHEKAGTDLAEMPDPALVADQMSLIGFTCLRGCGTVTVAPKLTHVNCRERRPFFLNLIANSPLALYASLESRGLTPLPDPRVCRLNGNSSTDRPYIESWNLI
jgi:hypothetical protein